MEGQTLGEWIWARKNAGQPIRLPVWFEGKDDGTKSRLKALILQTICAEPAERIPIQKVCHGIKVINGKHRIPISEGLIDE